MKPGTLCIKVAGRDSGKKCVVLKKFDNAKVLIDGETRRRACNLRHIISLHKTLAIKENASHDEVVSVFKSSLGIDLTKAKKIRESRSMGKPKKTHKKKEKPVKIKKAKKVEKKQVKTEEKPKETVSEKKE